MGKRTTIFKVGAAIAGLTAVFAMAAYINGKQNTANESEQSAESAPSVQKEDITKDGYFLDIKATVDVADGRKLLVSAFAYCEKLDDQPLPTYKKQCTGYVEKRLKGFASGWEYFEASIPAVSSDVRNHEGLPSHHKGYGDNYAAFPVDAMKKHLKDTDRVNLYTVTDITPVKPDAPKP